MSMNGELRQIPPDLMDQLDDAAVVEQIMDGDGLSVDKTWDGLHYLLGGRDTGESAIIGGISLDHVDTDYGPPQYLTPDEVARYAASLKR